jgi:hypothetical protein
LELAASKFENKKYYCGVKSFIRWMGHVACRLGGREIYAKTLWIRSHTGNSPFEKPKSRWEDNKRVYAKRNRIGCN